VVLEVKHLLLFSFIVILLSSFVSAVPPFVGEATGDFITKGLIIDYHVPKYFKLGIMAELNFHVFNKSNGFLLDNSTVGCEVHVFNSSGHIIMEETASSKNHVFTLNKTMSKSQSYGWTLHCNNSYAGGYVSDSFIVTDTGLDNTPQDTTSGISVTLFILTVIIGLILVATRVEFLSNKMKVGNLVIKRGLIAVAIYLMMLNSAILATIAAQANLALISEMLLYMHLFMYAGYTVLIVMLFKTMYDILDIIQGVKYEERFGDG